MEPKCGGIIYTPLDDSFMTHEESDDLYFRMSKLEELVKGFKVDLDYLEGELEKRMEGSMRTFDLVNLDERLEKKI